MSSVLDEMERVANLETISEPKDIENALNMFFDMSLEDLIDRIERHKWIAESLSSGFVLNKRKLLRRSIRDIFMLIGYAPAVPWFEIPEEDTWFYENKADRKFLSAESCFSIARIINERKGSDPVLCQLCQIEFNSLIDYLFSITEDRRLDASAIRIRRFYDEYRNRNDAGEQARYVGGQTTIGDVISTACATGFKAWLCGCLPLNKYVEEVRLSYDIIRILFMDCIRMSLIETDRGRLKELLDQCSEKGKYDPENYEEFDFTDCYE